MATQTIRLPKVLRIIGELQKSYPPAYQNLVSFIDSVELLFLRFYG